jgi:hypothetical protein
VGANFKGGFPGKGGIAKKARDRAEVKAPEPPAWLKSFPMPPNYTEQLNRIEGRLGWGESFDAIEHAILELRQEVSRLANKKQPDIIIELNRISRYKGWAG